MEQSGESRADAAHTLRLLLATVSALSSVRRLRDVQRIVGASARELLQADGATFVLRELDHCYYVEEEAIAPLWKGQRFPLEQCISGWAMLHREPVTVPDVYSDERIPLPVYEPTFVRSLVVVPVRRSDPVAAIGVYWGRPHAPSGDEVTIAQALADSTAVALEHVRVLEELAATVELSSTDALTGVANRRAWDRALALALDAGGAFTVGLIDLDHFELHNDTHGHRAGDQVLRDCAAAWSATLRDGNLLARYGGEEFALLMPGDSPAAARAAALRLAAVTPAPVTVSVGLAARRAGDSHASLIERADAALYEAKRAGRNRIAVAD